jgi:arylsulfatase A-like enzyme
MDQGFDSFFDHITFWWDGPADRTVPIDDVLAWTAAHADRPRFVYIHTAEPHAPYTPPAAYAQAYRTAYRGPIDGSFDPVHGFEHATSYEELAHVVALYDAEVAYADARLGEFVDALQAAGTWDTTNLFVIADHGQEFLEHGHWEHGKNLYREALRIPMVAVGPDITHRGRVDLPVQLFDLMPTILDLAGLHPPYRLAGASLLPLLHDPDEPPQTLLGDAARPYTPGVDFANRVIVSSNHWIYASAGDDVDEYSAIAGGRWKLLFRRDVPVPEGVLRGVVRADGPVQRFALYDLEQDALELHDLLGTDGYRDVARELMLALVAWRQQHAPFHGGGGGPLELGGDQLRELRSLGYISNE